MYISVIICTYNRAQNLPDCINKLAQQKTTHPVDWEILIVDNNSSDNTADCIDEIRRLSPIPVRYAFEEKQGLSHARNKGISSATGEYIIFIDDDILVGEHWLDAFIQTFTEHDCDAVGGRISVESPEKIPDWILPDMYGFLGQQNYGEEACPLDGIERFPFGGNMGFNRRVFDKVGLFNTEMGRKGSGEKADELFKGEETEFFNRLAKSGGSIRYQPKAAVQHRILPYQLKKRFFLTLHFNEGYLTAKMDQRTFDRYLFGIPLFLYGQLLQATSTYLAKTLKTGSDSTMRLLMNVAYLLGMMKGFRAQNES